MRNLAWSALRRVDRLRAKHRIVTICGAKFLLSSGNWIDDRLRIGREFESRQLRRAIEHIRTNPIDLLVDVGANFGLYSVALAKNCVFARGQAFEPIKRNRAQLWANLYLNDLTEQIDVHAVALSDTRGEAPMQLNHRSTGQAAMLPAMENPAAESPLAGELALETVAVETGDHVLLGADQSVFIKIDAEGHELKVIAGMADFLARNQVSLQVESFPSQWPLLDQDLRARGFKLIGSIEHDHLYAKR